MGVATYKGMKLSCLRSRAIRKYKEERYIFNDKIERTKALRKSIRNTKRELWWKKKTAEAAVKPKTGLEPIQEVPGGEDESERF